MKTKRTKDSASFQYSACYMGDELQAYHAGGLPAGKRTEIFYHLNVEKCKRCRDLFRLLGRGGTDVQSSHLRKKIIERLKKTDTAKRKYPAPLKIQRGQIWTTSPRTSDARGEAHAPLGVSFPILVVSGGNGEKAPHNVIRVMPISFDTEYELAGETIVLDLDSPLMYPILLEIFNERPMLADNLDEYRGEVSSDDLGGIMRMRAQFLDGRTAKPDEEYIAWKEKELELAEYLSLPVNVYLWEEDIQEQITEIPVSAYRKAADTSEAELSEVTPHVLLKTDQIFLGVVQVRDRFLLRLVLEYRDGRTPAGILVDKRLVALEQTSPGVYEVVLGYADHMPETMELEAEIDGEHRVFHLLFRGKGKPE